VFINFPKLFTNWNPAENIKIFKNGFKSSLFNVQTNTVGDFKGKKTMYILIQWRRLSISIFDFYQAFKYHGCT